MIRASELWTKPGPARSRVRQIKLLAPAKLNLFLEVVGRRPDGYHDLETIFQEISLADELTIQYTVQGSGLSFDCDSRELKHSARGTNLVERAVQGFRREFPCPGRFRIRLRKRVPIGAGLGGGSSDAAATLLGCAWLTGQLTVRNRVSKKLFDLANRLGADVSFFLRGGTCLGTGLGGRLKAIEGPRAWFVLVFPRFSISTADVYRRLRVSLTETQSIRKIKWFLRDGAPSKLWAKHLFNRLEEVVIPATPVLRSLKESLLSLGCEASLMSGSGSSVFGVVSSPKLGERIAKSLRRKGYKAWLVHSVVIS